MRESQIQYKILKYLKTLSNGFFFKVIASNTAGVPDIVGVYRGKSIWIEVKSIKGKLSELQRFTSEKVLKGGGVYLVARDLEGVIDLINKLDKGQ